MHAMLEAQWKKKNNNCFPYIFIFSKICWDQVIIGGPPAVLLYSPQIFLLKTPVIEEKLHMRTSKQAKYNIYKKKYTQNALYIY